MGEGPDIGRHPDIWTDLVDCLETTPRQRCSGRCQLSRVGWQLTRGADIFEEHDRCRPANTLVLPD